MAEGIRRAWRRADDGADTQPTPAPAVMAAATGLVVIVVLLLIMVSGRSVGPDPFDASGQTWRQGLLAGEDIRLLDSGGYVARTWCDVCANTDQVGTWRREGDRILLTPTGSEGATRLLRIVSAHGCVRLVPNVVSRDSARFEVLSAYDALGESCSLHQNGSGAVR